MNPPTFDAIRVVLIEQFRVDAGSIGPQVALDQLGLDSLALMEFVFAVEDRFDVRIPEDRLDPRQAGLDAHHVEALRAQRELDQGADVLVVLDDQGLAIFARARRHA